MPGDAKSLISGSGVEVTLSLPSLKDDCVDDFAAFLEVTARALHCKTDLSRRSN